MVDLKILGLWRLNMDQLLTANVANKFILVWKIFRKIEATLIEVVYHFDKIIDSNKILEKIFIKIRG